MDKHKIINQINLKPLTDNFSVYEIEVILVNLFMQKNNLSTKNNFLKEFVKKNDNELLNKINDFLILKNIKLDLLILQKIFELLLERDEKKNSGTFYTPFFIVDYIVDNVIKKECKVVDPSCGCGAFLIGALEKIKKISNKNLIDIIENNLFGVDISKTAIRRTKIMLLLYALLYGEDKPSVKFNLVARDSILLNWKEHFSNVFSEGGFDVVIGNPPYAKLNSDYNRLNLSEKYKAVGQNSSPNLYILFLELMLKISKTNGSGGIIVPLSISFNSNTPTKRLRQMIQKSGGEWKFSFYDRSPDSLFGDSIKTRNSIILFNKGQPKKIYTTKLIRWNSKNRCQLFKNLEYQDLHNLSIISSIPKVSKKIEIETLNKLSNMDKIDRNIKITKQLNRENPLNLYVYNTAYNWISVFTNIPFAQKDNKEVIPDSLSKISCNDQNSCKILYSILNSNLVYWYWVVLGDGFHVTSNFIRDIPLPYWTFSEETQKDLCYLADKLYGKIKKYPITKINKGITIKNYNIIECMDIVGQIDNLLINELNLDPNMLNHLIKFRKEHISAGRDIFKNSEIINI